MGREAKLSPTPLSSACVTPPAVVGATNYP